MNYVNFPKVELHLHLDCSLSYEVVSQINPAISFAEYRESFVAPPKCTDLKDYLLRAIKGFELMQTKEQLRLVTLDLFEQLKRDHIIYAEIRFAPLLHIAQGLTPTEVVQTIHDAAVEAIEQTGVMAGLILCTLRHHTEEQSMETVQLAEAFKNTVVVGFDIAGDEAGFPVSNHIKAFEYAQAKKIPCTAHAGEACGADSVWETLDHFHPSRIGHGVRSYEDKKLMDFLKENNIHLEVCPTSNVQTNIFETIKEHTADQIYKSGISMSINTDARTISDTTLTREYDLMEQYFQWTKQHFLACNLAAIEHAFCPPATKAIVKEKLLAAYTNG
jgi:adenosine deaminase